MPSNSEPSPSSDDSASTYPGRKPPLSSRNGLLADDHGETTSTRDSSCPECGGDIARDYDTGGTVCTDCGLVLDEEKIDRTKAFYTDDGESERPAPLDNTLHDRGLATKIGTRNRDANDNSLSPSQRKAINRLRKQQKWQRDTSNERRLRFGLGENKRMASALGFPDPALETSTGLLKQAQSDDTIRGWSFEAAAAATIYIAARIHELPHDSYAVAHVARVPHDKVASCYRHFLKTYPLPIPVDTPDRHLSALANDLDTTDQTLRIARSLLDTFTATQDSVGLNPKMLAGATLYAASIITAPSADEKRFNQSDIATSIDCSPRTIQLNYSDVLAASADDLPLSREQLQTYKSPKIRRNLDPTTADDIDPH